MCGCGSQLIVASLYAPEGEVDTLAVSSLSLMLLTMSLTISNLDTQAFLLVQCKLHVLPKIIYSPMTHILFLFLWLADAFMFFSSS